MRLYAVMLTILLSILKMGNAQTGLAVKREGDTRKIVVYDTPPLLPMKKLSTGDSLPVADFFPLISKTDRNNAKNKVVIIKTQKDPQGITHYRSKQYYDGIEVAEVEVLMHQKEGNPVLAHGNLVPVIQADTKINVSEKTAHAIALKSIGENPVLWESSKIQPGGKQKYSPANRSKLVLVTRSNDAAWEEARIAYRFDILTLNPLGRYLVDIDAKTGEVIRKSTRLNEGDLLSSGQSVYHGTVPITISDTEFPEWRDSTNWHPDDWNAFNNEGKSWWVADTSYGIAGGYSNHWYDVLETPPVVLSGTGQRLSFMHRYSVEIPVKYEDYDGWDGMNVRISTDHGKSWKILESPSQPYTCSSLYSFGHEHAEGPGIPGWAGKLNDWSRVVFDISAYRTDTVIIRFAFASDPEYSTIDGDSSMFGWQIDNIRISNRLGNLFFDEAVNSKMVPKNIANEVRFLEGNYRLRESGRGGGISTYNALDVDSYSESVDFVSEQSFFTGTDNQPGVSVHWAQEVTYDYFLNTYGRKSYNDENGRLISYVNWNTESGKNNAFWIGYAAIFGAGNGETVNPLTSLDIVAHELTHGVTEYSAGLIYENEPGALNESFSDIFGTVIETTEFGLNQNSWQFGENIFTNYPNIRSMEDPKSRHQPDTYKGEYWRNSTSDPVSNNDYGGVHVNSGVQNYWFYLLSVGGTGENDHGNAYSVNGIGIEDAAKIAYRNLTLYLQPTSEFFDAAFYSEQAAIDLFGENSPQHVSVIDAWYAVGIYFTPRISVPSIIKFVVKPGQETEKSVRIMNLGMKNLNIQNIEISGDRFQLSSDLNFPVSILPEEELRFNVRFIAQSMDEVSGQITLYSDDPNEPAKTIALIGNEENNVLTDISKTGHQDLRLDQNFPNPFTAETRITYTLPDETGVTLTVYSLSGEEVRTLVNQRQTEGQHSVSWDGTNNYGLRLRDGIYIYTIRTDDFITSKRLIIR